MANPLPTSVQRLRYFDGEYLRSYDFTDEQSYHIAMRRLMNQKLHLSGIVYGLEIVEDATSTKGAIFYSISPGMAIDQTGREIVVPAPYSLNNLLNGPDLKPVPNEVWLCYQENETGLPAAGYLDCNVKNQNTRWQEGFFVQFQPVGLPGLFTDCGGVRLGVVTLDNSGSLGWQISKPVEWGRSYVGIRAQEIIAPDETDQASDPYDITAMKPHYLPDKPFRGYLNVHPGVFNHGNVIVKKNLVVGDDFELDNTTYTNLPSDFTTIPTGNVKITTDLFLNGQAYLYSTDNATWFSLKQYIQSLVPQSASGGVVTIMLPTSADSGGAPNTFATVQSNQFPTFPPGGTLTPVLTITEIDWQDPGTLQTYWGVSGASPIVVSLTNPKVIPSSSPGYSVVSFKWTVSPVADVTTASEWQFPITKLVVNVVVIYQP